MSIPKRLQICCGRNGQKRRGRDIGELQQSPAALNTLYDNDDYGLDVGQANSNPSYVMSAPASPGVSPLSLVRPTGDFDYYGSSVELNRFAAAPAGLAGPDPLVFPSPRLTTSHTNFSVPMPKPLSLSSPSPLSPQQRQRWENDRHYQSQPQKLPNHTQGSYFAIS